MNPDSVIYQIRNIIDNKIYIGSAKYKRKRFFHHRSQLRINKHANILLQRAWNKYGEDVFEFQVLEQVTPENLITREQFYLDKFKPFAPRGYNICRTAGSTLGRKRTKAEKEYLSKLNKGKKLPQWIKDKMKAAAPFKKKRPQTEATKQKLRERRLSNSNIYQTQEYRNKISASSKGRIKSAETCKKLSLIHKGIKKTPEHIAKLLESRYGPEQANKYRERMNIAS